MKVTESFSVVPARSWLFDVVVMMVMMVSCEFKPHKGLFNVEGLFCDLISRIIFKAGKTPIK